MTKIREWKMKRKKLFLCILGIWGIVLTSCGTKEDTQEQEELSGIPDVVSSAVFDTDYNLTVVANSDVIDVTEEFTEYLFAFAKPIVFILSDSQRTFEVIQLD